MLSEGNYCLGHGRYRTLAMGTPRAVAIAPLVACTLAAWGHVRYAHLAERPTLYVLPAA